MISSITEKSIGIDGEVFAERRHEVRRRAFMGATLTFNRGYGAMECLVRNLGSGGACLEFGDAGGAPARFQLAIAGHGKERNAKVIWRSMTRIGVAFE